MLTFMTYNIKNGGRGRLDAILGVIQEQRPDVLALQELGRLSRGPRRLVARIESATGMRAHLARSRFGQAVAVLVRPPVVIVSAGRVRRPLHHAAALVTVETGAGRLTVVSTHLHATSPGRRRREARRVVARLAGHLPDRPTVLMGDLNTLDPAADPASAVATVEPRYRRRHLSGGRVDSRAVQVLTDAGLIDLGHLAGPGVAASVPTKLGGPEFPVGRLDYILATAPVAALTSGWRVVRDGDTDTASDHYPVVATVELEHRGAELGTD
jgi:exodeoxyribonuclease III